MKPIERLVAEIEQNGSPDALTDVTDMARVRVILPFKKDLAVLNDLIGRAFSAVDSSLGRDSDEGVHRECIHRSSQFRKTCFQICGNRRPLL